MAWYEVAVDGDAGERLLAEQEATVHCFAYRASGTVTGPFPGVQELHRRLHLLPFVYEEKLDLAAHQVDPAELAETRLGSA